MIRRADLDDLLAVDGESVVLAGGKVFRLGPVATVILELLGDGPRTVGDIGDALAGTFGAPPDGDLMAAVADQIAQLRDAGLLEGDAGDPETAT